jgi:hypothetical protein
VGEDEAVDLAAELDWETEERGVLLRFGMRILHRM